MWVLSLKRVGLPNKYKPDGSSGSIDVLVSHNQIFETKLTASSESYMHNLLEFGLVDHILHGMSGNGNTD